LDKSAAPPFSHALEALDATQLFGVLPLLSQVLLDGAKDALSDPAIVEITNSALRVFNSIARLDVRLLQV
jgi:hypothetical protein